MSEFNMPYYDIDENSVSFEETDIELPRICMHCKNTGEQIGLSAVGFISDDDISDGMLFTTCQFCKATSIHHLALFTPLNGYRYYEVVKSIPKRNEVSFDFPGTISSKFPEFVKIYEQSAIAEDSELDHLAGMGYRKSLEFLITDYLLTYPIEGVEKSWITNPKTPLSQKIDKLKSQRVKELAKAISYLGNDETHYSRQHPEYDIESIKMFIKALVSDVENDMIYQEAKKFLNKPKS